MNNIGKYIREQPIVVTGVAIAFFIGVWITNASNKKDIDLYLNSIQLELEENINAIEEVIKYWQPLTKYANY